MKLNSKKKILLLYDYFAPAFKAGGPIQSCTNLVRLLHKDYQFNIITTNEDMGEKLPLEGIKSNCWSTFENKAKIFYFSRNFLSIKTLSQQLAIIQPDIVYINGIYSFFFSLFPIIYFKIWSSKPKIIVAPRGMLQPGSLSVKPLKKLLFIRIMKLIRFYNGITWHATTAQERQDIQQVMGKYATLKIAGNIPNLNNRSIQPICKEKGSIKITTIALISPMKNILKVIESLGFIKENVIYDIYGPIKDIQYWNLCIEAMKVLPSNIKVTYQGALNPHLVADTLLQYHFLVLPSKSENFGHVIFESFVAGRPVIISNKTPWNNLSEQHAGWNIQLENNENLKSVLDLAIQLDQEGFEKMCIGASSIAKYFIENSKFEDIYQELFN